MMTHEPTSLKPGLDVLGAPAGKFADKIALGLTQCLASKN
jgi:hypothetical protein